MMFGVENLEDISTFGFVFPENHVFRRTFDFNCCDFNAWMFTTKDVAIMQLLSCFAMHGSKPCGSHNNNRRVSAG